MAFKTSKVRAAAALDAILTGINSGASKGYYEIRTGSAPAALEDARTGTLLATCTMQQADGDPAFAATDTTTLVATAGVVSGKVAKDTSADATGTAGYFTLYRHDGTKVAQGGCGTSGSDMNLNTTSIVATKEVSVLSHTVTISGLN